MATWLPRFGFAYDVFGDGKTAVRGGFGLFYNCSGYLAPSGTIKVCSQPQGAALGDLQARLFGLGIFTFDEPQDQIVALESRACLIGTYRRRKRDYGNQHPRRERRARSHSEHRNSHQL